MKTTKASKIATVLALAVAGLLAGAAALFLRVEFPDARADPPKPGILIKVGGTAYQVTTINFSSGVSAPTAGVLTVAGTDISGKMGLSGAQLIVTGWSPRTAAQSGFTINDGASYWYDQGNIALQMGTYQSPLQPQFNGFKDLGAHDQAFKRLYLGPYHGAAPVSGDFVLSSGWGTSPTTTAISGGDAAWEATFTAKATTGANPTIAFTFDGGAWFNGATATGAPPMCIVQLEASSDVLTAPITVSTTQTVETITYHGTPVANATYQIRSICIGI